MMAPGVTRVIENDGAHARRIPRVGATKHLAMVVLVKKADRAIGMKRELDMRILQAALTHVQPRIRRGWRLSSFVQADLAVSHGRDLNIRRKTHAIAYCGRRLDPLE